MSLDRRVVLAALATAAWPRWAVAQAFPPVLVHKDPSCSCCSAWVDHIRAGGFVVTVRETPAINRIKAQLGVPRALMSCHTAEIDGYVLEGHVPVLEVKRLLSERPRGKGLAVSGMPVGSPGMDVPEISPDTYNVVLFGTGSQTVFARYKGSERL